MERNYAAPEMGQFDFSMPDFSQPETITKWIVVPAATVGALFFLKKFVFKGKKNRKRR
jgi:hypothetical protein